MKPVPQQRLSLPSVDTLSAIRERPAIVERAVRTALVEAMKWRLGGGAPPGEIAFACAAVSAARQSASRANARSSELAKVSLATDAAARRFFRAPLGKRLLSLPERYIVSTQASAHGADVVVRDRAERLHLVALTTLRRPLDINERARAVCAETPLAPHERLAPVRVHVFSLASGRRFECGALPAASRWTGAARSA